MIFWRINFQQVIVPNSYSPPPSTQRRSSAIQVGRQQFTFDFFLRHGFCADYARNSEIQCQCTTVGSFSVHSGAASICHWHHHPLGGSQSVGRSLIMQFQHTIVVVAGKWMNCDTNITLCRSPTVVWCWIEWMNALPCGKDCQVCGDESVIVLFI